MFPTPTHHWICKKCDITIGGHIDENSIHVFETPTCPKCGEKMQGGPIIHRGPTPHDKFKKY